MCYEELVISSGGIYIVHYIGVLIGLNKYMPLEKFKYYTQLLMILMYEILCFYHILHVI